MVDKICFILIIVWHAICQETCFWYWTERHYCKKNKGNCSICECWSCDNIKKGCD